MNEQLVNVAMQIILHAGDARNLATDALKAAKSFDFKKADDLMKKADESIVEAHKAQTETLQSEMSGEKHDYSILFSHAQDTLMTVMSEINLSKEIIDVLKIISEKTK